MYRNLNDYEIIYMVRESSDSFKVLYDKYKPLIYKIVKEYQNTFRRYGYEIDDLMQLGYIALYKSSRLYNDYSNSMFFSYLKKAILNVIITELRKNNTSKKEALNNAFSYDAMVPNTNCTYQEILMENKSRDKLLDIDIVSFKNTLEFTLACIFELYYHGYQLGEIAILLDEKKSFIEKSMHQIREQALTYKYLFLE